MMRHIKKPNTINGILNGLGGIGGGGSCTALITEEAYILSGLYSGTADIFKSKYKFNVLSDRVL